MSPVAQGGLDTRRALILGVIAVITAAGLIFLVTRLAGTGAIDVQLGDDRFELGKAERFSSRIADEGPILFPAAQGSRDIIVQHLGPGSREGWFVFDARRPGQPRECVLEWDAVGELFRDSCDRAETVPADGGDLQQYEVVVQDDGDVIVDIRATVAE